MSTAMRLIADTRPHKARPVVVITGATSGVGRATARAFAQRGAAIGLIARGQDGLDATAADVEALGARALKLAVDVTDAEAVDTAAATIEERFGPIDIWINNAATSIFAPTSEISADEYRRVTEVTYLGVVYGTQSALRRMRNRDRGVVVQVGSALAYRGIPLQSPYCAAKHAVQGFTESLRCELRHDESSINLTMVQLPALNTPQFNVARTHMPCRPQPVPPIYQPEVAARAILAAADHPARREWWVGGSTALTVLGNAVAPAVADRYLAWTGYDLQQTAHAAPEMRADNLFHALPGDRGAHGDFDDQARYRSTQWALTRHRRMLGTVGLLAWSRHRRKH